MEVFPMARLLISLVLVLLSSQAFGATYYIDPTGDNGVGSEADPFNACPTIEADNTYLWKRGTTQDIGARGLAVSGVVIGAYGTGARPILTNNGNYIFQLTTAVTTFTVQDVRLSDCTYAILVSTGGSGTYLTVDNCEIDTCANSGMSIHFAGTVEVKNSNIHDNAVDGIDFYGPGYLWAHDNVFDSIGTSGANNHDTISVQGTGLIEDNVITNQLGSDGSGIDAAHNTGSCIIRRNTLITGEGHGLGLNGDEADVATHLVTAYSNYITGFQDGAFLYNYGTYQLYNNTFKDCTRYGIRGGVNGEANLRNMSFINNIISGHETIKISMPAANGYTITSDYNCLYDSSEGADLNLYNDGTGHDTLAGWQEHGYDAHSITTAPGLTGYAIGYSSPCKDTGIALSAVTTDIVGRARAGLYDIGAFEFAQGVTATLGCGAH
jgi:hypothetical protein